MSQQPVSQTLAGSKLAALAPYVRDEQYALRDLGKLRGRSLVWSLLGALICVLALAGAFFAYFAGMETAGTTALFFLVPCIALYLILLSAFVRMPGLWA